ncbi:concanavalin A-like lectin/glucanase domain-containing protein [Podospora appendiculata]|uniref:chitinase n=1 Tax=Podospora appendiculata TaxID=314037 RepID=A0AAE0X7I4_9PEZI|nr:concanavalin A-like lectin/glucanase domain-containing protein [Podospora appendiculata]
MGRTSLRSLGALLVSATLAVAQTYTSCDPTKKTCPPDPALALPSYAVDFRTAGPTGNAPNWASIGTGAVTYSPLTGAAFTIAKKGDSPTLATAWYFFFGRAEVHLRTAPGQGIVSCVVLESDDLDEIDWEWIGGVPGQVQTNYFGKGNTTSWDRGTNVTLASSSQSKSMNYTIDWRPEGIKWFVDGAQVRELKYGDALGGRNYPQTPVRLKIGIWAGGDSDNPNGTIAWAGGVTDYGKGPFTMYVERVVVENRNPAGRYRYGDLSGRWESIVVEDGDGGSKRKWKGGFVAARNATKSGSHYSATASEEDSEDASGKSLPGWDLGMILGSVMVFMLVAF